MKASSNSKEKKLESTDEGASLEEDLAIQNQALEKIRKGLAKLNAKKTEAVNENRSTKKISSTNKSK